MPSTVHPNPVSPSTSFEQKVSKAGMFPFRLLLVLASFFLTVLLYIDRACISTAKGPIIKALNLDADGIQFGLIMAAFTLGYALLQAPTGSLADKFGSRRVITGIVLVWSILTAVTGGAFNYLSMLVTRFLFGAGEAGCFPALSKVAFYWFPVKERGIIQGINFSGSRIGAAAALPLAAAMIGSLGWRVTFFIFGIAGLVFAGLWFWLFVDKPEESTRISDAEKKYICENRQQVTAAKSIMPYGKVLASKNMWLAMVQYICSNFTFYFTLSWMYPFIKKSFTTLDPVQAGFFAAAPLVAGAIGNWVSGYMVDSIYKNGRFAESRRIPAIIGFVLSAIGMYMVIQFPNSLALTVTFLSLAVLGADMTLSPSWSFCIDIAKKNSGVVSGTMNMAGNIGAFVTIIAFPYLLKWTGSPKPFFYICCALSVLAVFLWTMMDPEKPIQAEA